MKDKSDSPALWSAQRFEVVLQSFSSIQMSISCSQLQVKAVICCVTNITIQYSNLDECHAKESAIICPESEDCI